MKYPKTLTLAAAVALAFCSYSTAFASEEDDAVQACTLHMRDTFGLNEFRSLWVEPLGHHKFKVHGKVKYDHQKHPFDCVVKRGHIKSYHYNGPRPGLADHDDDDKSDTAKKVLAVGAGLAIAAAIAKAAQEQGSEKTHMEDDCREALAHRMREDHHDSASFSISRSELKGDILSGEGNVRWGHARPNHVEFSCLFQDHRVDDTNYVLY